MNTQEGMGVILSLGGEYAARRRRTRDAIYDEMCAELELGNTEGAIELSKELKNWSVR